jgi:molecular chaperone DnaK (HSP70)
MKILSSILFALLLSLAAAQVVGIDLGTEFWKASLISPGKNLVIVENSRSSRKSHNGVNPSLFRSPSSKEFATSSTTPTASVLRSQHLLISILTN